MDSARILTRFCLKRNIYAVVAVLAVVVVAIIYFNRIGHIPSGTYVVEEGINNYFNRIGHIPSGTYVAGEGIKIIMVADNDNVRIVRGKSTLYSLPNRTNRKVYDKDDLAQSHPQRLFLVATDTVEWIREPVGPSPEYKVMFKSLGER